MKKSIVVALMVVFSVFAVGAAFAAINADGTLLIDKDVKVWPTKKLTADGKKKKNPVTFNHKKHGDLGCQVCHHQEKDLKAGAEKVRITVPLTAIDAILQAIQVGGSATGDDLGTLFKSGIPFLKEIGTGLLAHIVSDTEEVTLRLE